MLRQNSLGDIKHIFPVLNGHNWLENFSTRLKDQTESTTSQVVPGVLQNGPRVRILVRVTGPWLTDEIHSTFTFLS